MVFNRLLTGSRILLISDEHFIHSVLLEVGSHFRKCASFAETKWLVTNIPDRLATYHGYQETSTLTSIFGAELKRADLVDLS